MTMPCGNTAALREYERREAEAERVEELAEVIARDRVDWYITDHARLREMVEDNDLPIWRDLARLLDPTTKGERVEHYREQLRQVIRDAIVPHIMDECRDAAREELRNGPGDY